MANDINTRQNDEHILKCLVAQRRLYSKAKKWSYVPQLFLLFGTVIMIFWKMDNGSCCQWIMAVGIGIAWIFALIGETITSRLRTKAAKIQQYIDKNIYLKAFSEEQLVKWSNIPLRSIIEEEIAKVTNTDIIQEKVENWYSDYSSLSPQHAVFCCQKENIRWDFYLRILLIVVLTIINIIIGIVGIVAVWSFMVKDSIVILISEAGIISFLIKSIYNLFIDCLRINEMKSLLNNIEKKIENEETVGDDLIDIQNLIYENRGKAFLVPDWFYKVFRNKMQKKK